MSRIRSQLDAILSPQGTRARPQNTRSPAPRPAQPAYADNRYHANERPRPAAPRQSADNPVLDNAASQMNAIQQRLDQLTGKLGALSTPAPQPRRTASDTGPTGQSMLQEIREGFRQVKQELADARHNQSQEVGNDLQRISEGIALLQDSRNLHPDYIDQMQSELGHLQQGLEQLLSRQENGVDLSGVTQSIETGYSDIVNKLDMLLTGRDSAGFGAPAPDYADKLDFLGSRIEEMSRTLVSLAVSPDGQDDQHNFERLEARIASLTKLVEDMQYSEASSAMDPQHFERIDAHISSLAKAAEEMQQVGMPVSVDLSSINDRLDTLQNDIGILASGLEQRLASHEGSTALAAPVGDPAGLESLAGIEHRLAELADRLDAFSAQPGDNPNGSGQEFLSTLRELVEKVETLEARPAASAAAVDLSTMENRLAEIMQKLDTPSEALPAAAIDLAPLSERLDNIEGQIASSRDIVIEMATQAAENQSPVDAGNGAAVMSTILEELRELREMKDTLVPSSNAENTQLTEINTTIAALVARLDQFGQGNFTTAPATAHHQPAHASVLEEANAHQLDGHTGYEADQAIDAERQLDERFHANNADQAYVENAGHEATGAYHDAPSLDEYHNAPAGELNDDEGAADLDGQVKPELEDVPLAPGSGMPDLEALVRRATKRKKEKPVDGTGEATGEDGNISELMAAARRAAQAASVVAQAENANPKKARKAKRARMPSMGKPSFFSKKVLMMSAAVAAIAIGGLTLAPKITNMLGGTSPEPRLSSVTNPAPAVETKKAETEEVTPLAEGTVENKPEQTALLSPEPVAEMAIDKKSGDVMAPAAEVQAQPVPEAPEKTALTTATTPPDEVGNQALIQAASAGEGDALFEIGRRYTDGEGVERDLEKAVTWYEKSAETGYAPAQYRLGNFYEKGHGVAADPALAAMWYEKAAANGNALAMHNLAVLNAMGLVGSEADMPTAVSWFEKAADMGVKDSQVNLGILYTKGMGVGEDLEKAYKWFAVAAKGGDADAGKKRDTIAQAMRPEQLEKARGAAELWKPVEIDTAANVATVRDEWKSGPTLQSTGLSQEEIIRQTQQLLTRAGFDAGPADGKMGERTKNAIVLFQNKAGLPADGVISPALVEALSRQPI